MFILFLALALPGLACAQTPDDFRQDALSLEGWINQNYAYLDRFPDGAMPLSDTLRLEAEAVRDQPSLLRYTERALFTLADHHVITGSSFSDSWAIVPSYADIWVEAISSDYVITDVRSASPAFDAGLRSGDTVIAVGGIAIEDAVAAFWMDLGLEITPDRAAFAARVLLAGRRDRLREISVQDDEGLIRTLTLPSLYTLQQDRPPLESRQVDGVLIIRFNDSLGRGDTVAAFDAAMAEAVPGQPVVLDLTDTPSGGDTVVARGIMGWFVDRASPYQVHAFPAEERETGIPRQWVEQVLPRPGLHHTGPVTVLVGRWTGSMGEGLAIGFHALGEEVVGRPMAGLLGAIVDHRLPASGLIVKVPNERLYTVDGQPREAFQPRPSPSLAKSGAPG
jgi:carboxyl-terminal processing protease